MGLIGLALVIIGVVVAYVGETDLGRFLIIIGSIWAAAQYARQGKK